jgi:PAS domain S-box-containing protein
LIIFNILIFLKRRGILYTTTNIFSQEDLLKFFDILTDGIYISDDKGNTLWVNNASANICGKSRNELIGRNVRDLEKEGIFTPSVTRLALENGRTTSSIQSMRNGRKYLVTGHLILNNRGKIQYVVAHSRDITQAVKLTSQLEETEFLLRRYIQEIRNIKLRETEQTTSFPFVGRSKNYLSLIDLINKVANVDSTVLITGETGTGKNVVAKRIHQLSDRHKHPFVHINCGAIPESLMESELFGYKKGAFTGAAASGKVGLVKMAENGTLFLDEIGELPLHLQPKLLNLLQNKTYLPVGATKEETANVRIIAATNQDLTKLIEKGKFRMDLYYRLNVISINIPPLRKRREDILPLIFFYLDKFNKIYKKDKKFSSEVLDRLQSYDWPGNVRELENIVEHLVIISKGNEITLEDLPDNLRTELNINKTTDFTIRDGETLPTILERMEKKLIEQALKSNGTTRKAAEKLGVTQSFLMRRIKKYGIKVDKVR